MTASWLRCDYAHGATRQPIGTGRDSFRVVGITAEARRACASEAASAEAIQHTQAYADDAVATAQLTRAALQCVQALGISLSGPGVSAAEQTCKQRLEAARGVVEPAPLP